LRYEVEAHSFTLRLYESGAKDNYCASAQIRRYGDRGQMFSISSPRLFDAMAEHFDQLMLELGLTTLEGYMSKAMARAVRIKSRGWASYNVTHIGRCNGREMPWVVISQLKENQNVEIYDAGVPAMPGLVVCAGGV
jgi:hypothetical protein